MAVLCSETSRFCHGILYKNIGRLHFCSKCQALLLERTGLFTIRNVKQCTLWSLNLLNFFFYFFHQDLWLYMSLEKEKHVNSQICDPSLGLRVKDIYIKSLPFQCWTFLLLGSTVIPGGGLLVPNALVNVGAVKWRIKDYLIYGNFCSFLEDVPGYVGMSSSDNSDVFSTSYPGPTVVVGAVLHMPWKHSFLSFPSADYLGIR